MKILLITPPMTQINTPYPATAYLKGYLDSVLNPKLHSTSQADFGIELIHRIFSQKGLQRVYDVVSKKKKVPPSTRCFLERYPDYLKTIDPTLRFLRSKDPTLALQIGARGYLPEGPRFASIDASDATHETLQSSFGALGVVDRAHFFASLYLDDLADVLTESIDSDFAFSKYGEHLAASQLSFDPLFKKLNSPPTLLDQILFETLDEFLVQEKPHLIGLSVPFPGNVYCAFRIAQAAKKYDPKIKIVMGGGYVNTELRNLNDPRVFQFIDALTFDDGEGPLLQLIEYYSKKQAPTSSLIRTFLFKDKKLQRLGFDSTPSKKPESEFKKLPAPSYAGLPLQKYIGMFEMLNPVHRLWTGFFWNKLTLAHGCYWKKCTFCDLSLDYISRYETQEASSIVDKMESIIRQTGQSGFHFVDEAAPPAVLKAVSNEILKRGLTVTWWGNIRFEKSFTPELAQLMAQAGCIALTGGLEVASPRVLKLMNKGVTIDQVFQVTRALSDTGIFVHAYLMYGFPTQTLEETVDSLDVVRKLFDEGCIQSAFWHRFSATVHSPIGQEISKQSKKEANPFSKKRIFAINDLPYTNPLVKPSVQDATGAILKKALYNYMLGVALDIPAREFFKNEGMSLPRIPATTG